MSSGSPTTAGSSPQPAAWGEPFARLNERWTRFEASLCTYVIIAEIAAMSFWIAMKGLSSPTTNGNQAGLVFRALFGAAVLGTIAFRLTRKQSERNQRIATMVAMALGWFGAGAWVSAGVDYFSNILNWYQDASTLTMVGGLRGVGTQLTIWLAVLGASLATAGGKHINVDAVMRFLTPKYRNIVGIIGWVTASVVCFTAVWGFLDQISIESFEAQADSSAGDKMAAMWHGGGTHLFLLWKQFILDMKTLPHVLVGEKYDSWLHAVEWNAWIRGGGWDAHYSPDQVSALFVSELGNDLHSPLLVVPNGTARSLLAHDLYLLFPFGMLMVGLRFAVRALMVASGHASVDPDAVHDDIGAPKGFGEVESDEDLHHAEEAAAGPRSLAPATTFGGGNFWRLALIGVGLAAIVLWLTMGWTSALVGVLALLGTPLFAVMGGISEIAWLHHPEAAYHHLRYIAPTILDERFAGSPILITIPLFTFVGYIMAESKTPDRIVRTARAWLGWLPGGLALVCIVASEFFNIVSTGVTIVAIGGLLYPALRKHKYPESFSLGLVTIGGSIGFLIPPSLTILIYALVAGLDFNKVFKAGFIPGTLIVFLIYLYSAYVAIKYKVPRDKPNLREMGASLWGLKWELFIPILILGGLGTGLTSLDEMSALTALYVFCVEVWIYRDVSFKKDLTRIIKISMSLAGALILILAMANALINYVIQEQIPGKILDRMVGLGITETWKFLIVLNIFLLILGMIMDGFSAILVAVPLILPFAAKFHLNPFQLAMMVLLNLEIAFCTPPLGLNLFISSFRFNRPVTSLYRIVLPFAGILTLGLLMIMYIPSLSTIAIAGDLRKAQAIADAAGVAPRDKWILECVQDDPNNPHACTPEDHEKWETSPKASLDEAQPDKAPSTDADDLFRQMTEPGAGSPGTGEKPLPAEHAPNTGAKP